MEFQSEVQSGIYTATVASIVRDEEGGYIVTLDDGTKVTQVHDLYEEGETVVYDSRDRSIRARRSQAARR